MLVLTRKTEQSIIIGDNVEVMVLGVSGNTVRLGILAPREVNVNRKEVLTSPPEAPKPVREQTAS